MISSGAHIVLLLLLGAGFAQAVPGLIWPTPNAAFEQRLPIEKFVQPTVSGEVESGLFGCVRNSGAKFHEGLDLFPVGRDLRGEALDQVYSIRPGRVVYVSATAGHSNYGRYIVVVHDEQSVHFHSLYAHMATIDPAIQAGTRVQAGTVLGIMGRSAGGYSIPRSRAHLHLEIGFRLTDDFQAWFDRQKFGSKNRHGVWNGINLVSLDPLDFYESVRDGKATSLRDYLQQVPVVARIRVHTTRVPDFVKNYPGLLTHAYAGKDLVAWDIAFTEFGLPKEWTPRFADENLDGQLGDVRVLTYNPSILKEQSCRRVISFGGKIPAISKGTIRTIKMLFGFK